MDPSIRLPDHLVEHALAFSDGSRTPVEAKHASTVVLLRRGDGTPGSLQVYLLRRHVDMAFAAGMCVFPGGGVDPRDFDHQISWAGPTAAQWAERMGVEESLARALVCAAVRETFEESGVLLAGPTPDSVVSDTTGEDWEADRRALEAREVSFTDFLDRRGLSLRTDLLALWGSWVTPVFEPRRYDTRFFVAEMPEGQVTRDVSTESDEVTWLGAMEAVEAVEAKKMFMLPPTYFTCLEVAQHATPAEVLAAAEERSVEMFTPSVERDGEVDYLSMPDGVRALLAARTSRS
jgi:8-oxo-dGTP pyrophosphatase MutT (NUDIX family)